MHVSILERIVFFVFGKHNAGVPSEVFALMRFDVEHDGAADVDCMQFF